MRRFVFEGVENFWRQDENPGTCTQQFLLFQQCFQNPCFSWLKTFPDNKINVTEKSKLVLANVKKIGEMEKILVNIIISFSNNVFERLLFQGC